MPPNADLQRRFVHLLVEAHEQRIPHEDRRGSEVTRPAEHECQQGVIIRPILVHREGGYLPTLGDGNPVRIIRQLQCLVASQFRLRIDLLLDLDAICGKKLLRFDARCSPIPMVVPIDRFRHDSNLPWSRTTTVCFVSLSHHPEFVAACVLAGRFPGQMLLHTTAGGDAGRYRETRIVRTCRT